MIRFKQKETSENITQEAIDHLSSEGIPFELIDQKESDQKSKVNSKSLVLTSLEKTREGRYRMSVKDKGSYSYTKKFLTDRDYCGLKFVSQDPTTRETVVETDKRGVIMDVIEILGDKYRLSVVSPKKQKNFSEYDAMRSLYVALMRNAQGDRRREPQIIETKSLIPILKGNNIVIERFVISTSFFSSDKYRMYLKIGAKAKLPDDVRLDSYSTRKTLGDVGIEFNKAGGGGGKKNKGGGGGPGVGANLSPDAQYKSMVKAPSVSISYEVRNLLGEAIKYDKKDRSLVLEFSDVNSAVRALNVLPFGIYYKTYLLDS